MAQEFVGQFEEIFHDAGHHWTGCHGGIVCGRNLCIIAPMISFGFCAFVFASIVSEFWKGSRAIQAKESISLLKSAYELTWRNTRRYGGYLVHMGIVIMFVGFTGSAFNQHETVSIGHNKTVSFAGYDFTLKDVNDGDNPQLPIQPRVSVERLTPR